MPWSNLTLFLDELRASRLLVATALAILILTGKLIPPLASSPLPILIMTGELSYPLREFQNSSKIRCDGEFCIGHLVALEAGP